MKIFLHIPKCGGSTVRDVMIHHYLSDQLIKVYGKDNDRNYYSKPSFFELVRNGLSPHTKAICGHFNLEDVAALESEDTKIFSLIRDPIDREISNINYLKISEKHPGHDYGVSIGEGNLFEVLIRKGVNWQSTCLGWGGGRKSLKRLTRRVSLFKLESYRQCLFNFGYLSNIWDEIPIKNVTKDIRESSEIDLVTKDMLSDKDILALKDAFKVDYELYDVAQ